MRKCRIIVFELILFGLFSDIFSVDYYILTNIKAKVYKKPNERSKTINYNFEYGEIISVYDCTNLNGKEWYFIKMIKNKEGWILKDNVYDVRNLSNGEYYYEILNREILKSSDYLNIYYKIVEVNFFEYSKHNYYGMGYIEKADDGWLHKSILYLLTNNTLIRAMTTEGIDLKFYFTNNFIIVIDKDGVVVYDNQAFEKDYEISKNPMGRLYKAIFGKSLSLSNQYKLYDSYIEYNETNGVMTEYIRVNPKGPYIVKKYKFKDGKFEEIAKTGVNN